MVATGFRPMLDTTTQLRRMNCRLCGVLQHVGDNERQVVLGDGLLAVRQLLDAFQHQARLLVVEHDAEVGKVELQAALAAQLAKRVAAPPREPLRRQPAGVQIALVVAVGMNAGGLR